MEVLISRGLITAADAERSSNRGVLLQAIAAVAGEQPRLTAAGRTDAGAHAHGQVVGCSLRRHWDTDRLRQAINSALPEDVVVVDAAVAPPAFHARFDAVARRYRYVVAARRDRFAVSRQYAWYVRGPLYVEAMRHAGDRLVGRHDFAAFGRSPRPGGSTVRTVNRLAVRRVDVPDIPATPNQRPRAVVVVDVEADAFLYGMMRSIAGVLVAVGGGRMSEDEVAAMLDAGAGQRARVPVAPARGLHQWRVTYSSPGQP